LKLSFILPAAKVLLAVVLIVVLALSVDLKQVVEIFKAIDLKWAVVCVIWGFLLILFQDMVLGVVASPFAKIPRIKLLAFTLLGRFFSLFFPSSIGGDFIKGYYLIPYFSRPAYVYASMAVHRVLGGVATILVAIIAGLLFLPETLRDSLVTVAPGIIAITLATILVSFRYFELVRKLLLKHREKQRNSRIYRKIYDLLGAVSAYRHHPRVVARGFLLRVVATQVVVGMYLLVSYALGVPFSYPQALVSSTVTSLAVLLPITPGGVGVSEGTFVIVAGAMGVPGENALSIVIFGRFIGYFCTLPGALIYVGIRKEKI